jgi:hypothetical protein
MRSTFLSQALFLAILLTILRESYPAQGALQGGSWGERTSLEAHFSSPRESKDGHRSRDSAESPIEIERMKILVVGRDEHVVDPDSGGAIEQCGDQTPSDALSLLVLSHGDIVNKDFGALCPRHGQRVRRESSNDGIADECSDRPKVCPTENPIEIGITQRLARFFEDLCHHGQHRSRQLAILDR